MLKKVLGYWGHPSYAKAEEIRHIDAIAVVPFGTRHVDQPNSWSNKALAEVAREYQKRFPGVKFMLQWEFANEQVSPAQIVGIRGNPHISTRTFFAILTSYCANAKIGILAHPAHTWRCKWIAEKMGFRVYVLDPGTIPYSPGNTHWQVRNSIFYLLWERLSRFHHALKGWI